MAKKIHMCYPRSTGVSWPKGKTSSKLWLYEIARNSVESKRPSELIGYATAAPFANDLFETAFAIEDSNNGI